MIKISTLKDLRDCLNKVSDEDLEQFGIGVGEDSEEVGVIALSTDPVDEGYAEALKLFENNKDIIHVDRYIKAVVDIGINCYNQEETPGLIEYEGNENEL